MNSNENIFTMLDYIGLIIFLIPNICFILHCHLDNIIPNIFMQLYFIFNFFHFYVRGNSDLIVLGALNIIIFLSLFSVDEDTYYQFSNFYDFLGIRPYVIDI